MHIAHRIQDIPVRQGPDSLEFQLVRARLSAQESNPREVVANFDRMIEARKFGTEAAARYGLVVALLRVGDKARARKEMALLQGLNVKSPMIDALGAQTLIAVGEIEKGLASYREALRANPNRTALIYGYVDALFAANRAADAVKFLDGRRTGGLRIRNCTNSRPAPIRLWASASWSIVLLRKCMHCRAIFRQQSNSSRLRKKPEMATSIKNPAWRHASRN